MEGTLADRTSEAICRWIIRQNLQPSHKLPNEYDLAASLKVGRGTLGEAVKILISRNILKVRHGSGTYVSKQPATANDTISFDRVNDREKIIKDLFELRYIVEPEVVLLAAQHRSESDLFELEKLVHHFKLKSSFQKHLENDIAFHTLLFKMTHNLAVQKTVPLVQQSINSYNHFDRNIYESRDFLNIYEEIAEALHSQDLIQAKTNMQLHLATIQRLLKHPKGNYYQLTVQLPK